MEAQFSPIIRYLLFERAVQLSRKLAVESIHRRLNVVLDIIIIIIITITY